MKQTDIRELYESVKPDDIEDTVPPYQHIKEEYSNTLGAKFSGLPGYTPPTVVYVLILLYRLFYILFVANIVLALITIFFDVSLLHPKWIGSEILTIPSEEGSNIIVRLTPILSAVLGLIVFSNIAIQVQRLAIRISRPYENEYESWLESIKPPENMYPPHQYWWSVAKESEFGDKRLGKHLKPVDNPPSTAPRTLRQSRLSERILDLLTAVFLTLFSFLFLVITVQLESQIEVPLQDHSERAEEVQQRKKSN